ncbi:microtubule-associated protein 10-like, partial [Diadema antillarum]
MNAEETLFSLELAVNSVRVVPRTLLCRMPAVAFRLLDFPSVIIEQMESTEMKQIKEAVQRVWGNGNDVPIQLEELKDRHGNYEFNKGKSSLFKYNINSLQSHLLNTPLYVMIVELWNNTPKLVGHCNVALNGMMNEIKADVIESGISIPSVHGIQGRFPIFNLMGSEVGWISLGIRMLSLGGNLIPHIPDAALTGRSTATISHPLGDVDINVPKSNPKGAPSKQYQGKAEEETTNHADQKTRSASLSIPPIPKHVEVDVAHPAHDLKPVQSDYTENVDEVGAVSHGSGTGKGHKHIEANGNTHQSNPCHSTVFLESEQSSDVDIITNTHIPPPLYFNSVNEPAKERKRDSEVRSGVQQTIHAQNTAETWRKSVDMQSDSKASSSSLGERRELEVHYVLHPPQYQGEPSVRKTLRKHHRDKSEKSMKNLENSSAGKAEVSRGGYEDEQENIGHQTVEDLRRMPILNALLHELSLLYRQDGSALLPPPIGNNFPNYPEEKQHHKKQGSVQKESKTVHHKEPEPSPVVKSQSLKTYRHKHRDCAKPPSGVPASKGWLRQEPAVRRKKETKLQFKMTNSQKLRLQRHNPDAYQLLEEQERIAEIQFQIRSAQLQEERSKNSAHRQRSK